MVMQCSKRADIHRPIGVSEDHKLSKSVKPCFFTSGFYQWGMVEKGSFKCLRSVGFFIGTMHDIHGQFTNNYEKRTHGMGQGYFVMAYVVYCMYIQWDLVVYTG